MASFRSALALISICILVCISGFADCRVSSQREQLARENEQNDHLPATKKEEFGEIVRETQALSFPFERSDLRENDGIFHGERSRGFRFGRPGGCHHGKFNRRGQRKSENMHFPNDFIDLRAESGDFHPRMDRPLPENRGFDPEGEWRHLEGKGNEHMPFPARKGLLDSFLETFLRPFPGHDGPAERDFHPRMDRPLPEERHFNPDFPRREWRHPGGEKRREGNEHMPFPPTRGWLEFFFHPFFRPYHDTAEFHRREGEFRPLPRNPEFGHSSPRVDEFHPKAHEFRREFGHDFPRVDEFQPREDEFGHGFPREDKFHPKVEEFRREFGHDFPRVDEFHPKVDKFGHGFPRVDEFHPKVHEFQPREDEFGHGFPRGGEFHPKVDEFRREFGHDFPRVDEFHPRRDEFGHGFPNGAGGRQHRDETGGNEQMPFPEEQDHPFSEHKEVYSRTEEFMPLPRVTDFHHGFPGREERQARHRHGEEEKDNEHLPFLKESFTDTLPVQAESTEFLRLPRGGDFEQSFGGGERGKELKID